MSRMSGAARGKSSSSAPGKSRESVDDKHRALNHMRRVLKAETRPACNAGS